MANAKKFIETAKTMARSEFSKVDTAGMKEKANQAGDVIKERVSGAAEVIGDKAAQVKVAAIDLKEDIELKLTELDRQLDSAITNYNDAYTMMNDHGLALFIQRTRAVDAIGNIEGLVNSIANHPKSFDVEFNEINIQKNTFSSTCEFAEKELQDARKSAESAGAGIAAGATVASLAPSAAMWIATTFGTASTGTAISALTGVAAQNAALAWLGGGTLATGGGGIAAGNAFLALAGPLGIGIAGVTLLSSIVLFARKKVKINKEKSVEIESVLANTTSVKKVDAQIKSILTETNLMRSGLSQKYSEALALFNRDYLSLSESEKMQLGALVTNTKSLSMLLGKSVIQEDN